MRAHRVQLICPAGNARLTQATYLIIALLMEKAEVRKCGGITFSSVIPPMFVGQFWDRDESDRELGRWIEDQNVLIVFDVPGESRSEILRFFALLKDEVAEIYLDVGEEQKALWVTVQPLSIVWD